MTKMIRRRRLVPVVDRRTFRKAVRRVNANVAAGDFVPAWTQSIAITQWLNSEQHFGRQKRRAWMRVQLPIWQSRADEYNPIRNAPGA